MTTRNKDSQIQQILSSRVCMHLITRVPAIFFHFLKFVSRLSKFNFLSWKKAFLKLLLYCHFHVGLRKRWWSAEALSLTATIDGDLSEGLTNFGLDSKFGTSSCGGDPIMSTNFRDLKNRSHMISSRILQLRTSHIGYTIHTLVHNTVLTSETPPLI